MDFLTERIKSVVSKKVAVAGSGFALLEGEPIAQAIVLAVYLLGQAYVDSKGGSS